METGFSRVRFNNFKNLEPREMKWSPGLNLLTGVNGSGKTNILEGINIISGWGPLERGTRTNSLPTWNSGTSDVQLTGQLNSEYGEIIKVKISGRYSIKIDDKTIKAAELRCKIPVLSFLPNDMSILEDSASYRRRLLDMILALLIPAYAVRLCDYRRGIRQKSILLGKGYSAAIVDRALVSLAAWIWRMREEAVLLLSDCMEGLGELLPARIGLSLARGGAGFAEDTEEDYIKALQINRVKEAALRASVVGPHRDDLVITADGKSAAMSLSRGLRRRVAIALMLAASDGVRRKLGREPVLLLDEVTAELDAEGRKVLFEALTERKGQVFAATAEPFISGFPGKVYTVSEGRVISSNDDL
ncbi:MAG: DNA replication and repair protein RecF [Synergistaceae bacterium]|nr:DNA replication and repair protein RecF [Synergistaceae bacterium]